MSMSNDTGWQSAGTTPTTAFGHFTMTGQHIINAPGEVPLLANRIGQVRHVATISRMPTGLFHIEGDELRANAKTLQHQPGLPVVGEGLRYTMAVVTEAFMVKSAARSGIRVLIEGPEYTDWEDFEDLAVIEERCADVAEESRQLRARTDAARARLDMALQRALAVA